MGVRTTERQFTPPDSAHWCRLQRQLTAAGQRRLVVVAGERSLALAWLQALLPALALTNGLWTGPQADCPLPGLQPVRPGDGRQWLGREIDLLVWDGWQGNPPDSLAAFSGTLKAGGLLFWLMPPLPAWDRFEDPDYHRTGLANAATHPFAARLSGILANDPQVIRVELGVGATTSLSFPGLPETPFAVGPTAGQRQLMDDIVRLGHGRRRRPLVITADRGRGKSAALGMAAVRLLQEGRRRIVVTAPSPEAVATLFHHARIAAAKPQQPSDPVAPVRLPDGAVLEFLPIDVLLAERPEAELVIVDEAAAIPAPLLKSVLLGWPRLAFATTVHGYEGSGRGFAIRFRGILDHHTPHWRGVTLDEPVRWAAGDPLEAVVRKLFLLDAESVPVEPVGSRITVSRWHPAEASERERAEAFGLLVDAHYRTSPGDLRQWLDDPHSVSWKVCCDGQLAGVLWGTVEGGLDPALAEQVMLGRRRLRGQLLPQSLASHSGFAEAATLRVLRVVRVAVHAAARNRGLGRQLVAAAREYARAEGLDGIGTSFGGSPSLVRFWQDCGLALVRLGIQREASSGEYAVQMLAGLRPQASALADRMACRLAGHWPVLVPTVWPALDPELLLLLSARLPASAPWSADDQRDLHSFATGSRGFELVLPVLRQLSLRPGVAAALQRRKGNELWVRGVMQGWSWRQLQDAGLCRGRRDGEAQLRELARNFL